MIILLGLCSSRRKWMLFMMVLCRWIVRRRCWTVWWMRRNDGKKVRRTSRTRWERWLVMLCCRQPSLLTAASMINISAETCRATGPSSWRIQLSYSDLTCHLLRYNFVLLLDNRGRISLNKLFVTVLVNSGWSTSMASQRSSSWRFVYRERCHAVSFQPISADHWSVWPSDAVHLERTEREEDRADQVRNDNY